MSLPEKYAGQHVRCPKCRAMLRIPNSKEDPALTRWFCKCGLRLKARARIGGRKLRCPRCAAQVIVPFPDSKPPYLEEDFILDESSGVVLKADETPLILDAEPEVPEAASPPAKGEDAGSYELEPAQGGNPGSALPAPAPPPKAGAKKRKKSPSGKAQEEESWAEDPDK